MVGYLRRGLAGSLPLGKGVGAPLRGDYSGALVTTDGHARFQEAVLQGNVYIGTNPAGTAVTTQAGLSATTPALTLFNPTSSTVNLVLWFMDVQFTAAPAAACGVILAFNLPSVAGVATAPITVTNANITNGLLGLNTTGTSTTVITQSGNQGQCYRIATLNAAPLAVRYPFGTSGAAAISGMSFTAAFEGSIIVPPGIAISVQTTSADAVTCAFVWEEVQIG